MVEKFDKWLRIPQSVPYWSIDLKTSPMNYVNSHTHSTPTHFELLAGIHS